MKRANIFPIIMIIIRFFPKKKIYSTENIKWANMNFNYFFPFISTLNLLRFLRTQYAYDLFNIIYRENIFSTFYFFFFVTFFSVLAKFWFSLLKSKRQTKRFESNNERVPKLSNKTLKIITQPTTNNRKNANNKLSIYFAN